MLHGAREVALMRGLVINWQRAGGAAVRRQLRVRGSVARQEQRGGGGQKALWAEVAALPQDGAIVLLVWKNESATEGGGGGGGCIPVAAVVLREFSARRKDRGATEVRALASPARLEAVTALPALCAPVQATRPEGGERGPGDGASLSAAPLAAVGCAPGPRLLLCGAHERGLRHQTRAVTRAGAGMVPPRCPASRPASRGAAGWRVVGRRDAGPRWRRRGWLGGGAAEAGALWCITVRGARRR